MVCDFESWLKKDSRKTATINIYIKFVKEYLEWYLNNRNQQSISIKKEDLKEFISLTKQSKRYSTSTIKVIIFSVKKFNSFLIASDCDYESYL